MRASVTTDVGVGNKLGVLDGTHFGHVQFARGSQIRAVASAITPIVSTKLVVSRTVRPNDR